MYRSIRQFRSRVIVPNVALFQNRGGMIRKFSTNPMFPERARPEIDSFFDKPEKPGDKKSNATPDFLSNHGGKVALVALAAAIALFYSYWVGGQNRNKVEEEVLKYALIEPYEIQEMRYLNNVSTEEYVKVVQQCKDNFRGGFTTYDEFVKFLKTQTFVKNMKLQQNHLLDRLIHAYIVQTFQIKNDTNLDTSNRKALYFGIPKDASSPPASNFHDVPISLDLLLVAFSLLILEDGLGRVEGLFKLAEINSSEYNPEFVDSSNKTQDTTTSNTTNASADDTTDHTVHISTKSVQEVIRLLVETDQIPPEKQVIEEGTKWPYKLYRRRRVEEMIDAFRAAHKIPADKQVDSMTLLEFQTLLLSSQVCAWAECYRSKAP